MAQNKRYINMGICTWNYFLIKIAWVRAPYWKFYCQKYHSTKFSTRNTLWKVDGKKFPLANSSGAEILVVYEGEVTDEHPPVTKYTVCGSWEEDVT